MQEVDAIRERTRENLARPQDAPSGRPFRGLFHWHYLLVYLMLVGLILLAILPPLVNVSRFKRRIVTSISTSIGRPVHLDNVSLVLLPFPGFKLENFVVEEAPAFGAEPVIHANSVVATLRVISLWRRKVEFSKISLQEPSINLVHIPIPGTDQGKWNVESILLQAAQIPVAPTEQPKAGPEPRFPYIEATGARVNIKYGDEKLPLSLTEADFALWLPHPQQWRVRIEGKPTRTDISAAESGIIALEGTLGRAERLDLIPIDLSAEWKNAPVGEASRLITGRDAGLRGDLRLNVAAHGTVGNSIVKAVLSLRGARRAEFVPQESLNLRAECQATAAASFRALHNIRCIWPPPGVPSQLALTADMADVRHPTVASFELGTPSLPAATLLSWLRVASPRVSPEVSASGSLSGSINWEPFGAGEGAGQVKSGFSKPESKDISRLGQTGVLSGRCALKGITLSGGPLGDTPVTLGDVSIASRTSPELAAHLQRERHAVKLPVGAESFTEEFHMPPATLTLGGKDPAIVEGRFDRDGYSLRLTGSVVVSRLLALTGAVPQFGDGLAVVLPVPSQAPGGQAKDLPIHLDLVSRRLWGGGQSWSKAPTKQTRSSGEVRRR